MEERLSKTGKGKARPAVDLEKIDADVVAFQEMGERPFLNELWMDLNVTKGPIYPHAIWMPAGDPDEVRHLALFSKNSL